MYSEITQELLEAHAHIEQMRAELAAKRSMERKNKKTVQMEKLHYRFQPSAKSGICMLSEKLNFTESEIARAAMHLGLQQLNEVYERDQKKVNSLMHVIKLRAMLGK